MNNSDREFEKLHGRADACKGIICLLLIAIGCLVFCIGWASEESRWLVYLGGVIAMAPFWMALFRPRP